MDAQATMIISALGATVASLASFVYFIFRQSLTRADARIATLEEREDKALAALAESVKAIQAGMQSLLDAFREVRILLSDVDRRGGRG